MSIDAARGQAAAHTCFAGRAEMRDYACRVAHRSADDFESEALPCVGPKLRRDVFAKDAEADLGINRSAAEHAGDDCEYGTSDDCDESPEQRFAVAPPPERQPDSLREDAWQNVRQFHRARKSQFVRDMLEHGALRGIHPTPQLW